MSPSPELVELTRDVLAKITQRQTEAYETMRKQMNVALYGDQEHKPAPPTRRQTAMRAIKNWCKRVVDAWLVLRGKAEVYRDE